MSNWTEASLSDRTPQPLAQRSPRLEKNVVFSPVIPQLRPTASILHAFRASAPTRKMTHFNHRSLES